MIYDDSDSFEFSDGASPDGLAFLTALPTDGVSMFNLRQLNLKLDKPVVYLKRPFVRDGKPVQGAFIILLLDFEQIDQILFGQIQIGARGFVSVMAKTASGEMVVPPRVATQTNERTHFLEFSRGWKSFTDIPTSYRSIVLEMKELSSRPFAVVSVASLNDIHEPVLKLIYFSGAFGLLALMGGIWSTFFFSRRLTDPIRILTLKAEQLARDNSTLSQSIETPETVNTHRSVGIEAQDELGRLTSSFSRMQAAITEKINVIESQNEKLREIDLLKEELNHSLEVRVAMRTSELRVSNSTLKSTLDDLQAAQQRAQSKTDQVSNLLNNSEQGFMSFGADRIIDTEFSRACETMLGRSPSGCDAALVFFYDDASRADLFCTITSSVLAESDPCIQESMLSLLPAEIQRENALLKAEYKILENGKFMVILTDITEKRRMEHLLEIERHRLEMIVMAVSDSRNFFDTSDAFCEFLADGLPNMLNGTAVPQILAKELFREIHTYKGVLNQFSFSTTPKMLHDIETSLSGLLLLGDTLTRQKIAELVSPEILQPVFDKDLAIVSEALGKEFLVNRDQIFLSDTQVQQLEKLAKQLLRGETVDTSIVLTLLNQIVAQRKVLFMDVLMGFSILVKKAAERMEKDVAPLQVIGDADIWIDPKPYKAFFRSLVHVFRNAVVHGLETPDGRWEAEKDEAGKITCSVEVEGNAIKLVIADDGAGINLDALRERAVATGLYGAGEVQNIPDEEIIWLIFMDNISTQKETTELAGRGVGLAAVLSETKSLGGDVFVKTVAGGGTQFLFSLPWLQESLHDDMRS